MATVGPTDDELYKAWLKSSSVEEQTKIIDILKDRNLFPGGKTFTEQANSDIEEAVGLYPDTADPLFIEKLLHKREFAETKQKSLRDVLNEGTDLCDKTRAFELSPVQRFISRFLSPSTPYNSALLYHGVGVGKTCAAISTAEAFLERHPKKSVIIIAPPNIQPNFMKEIFNYSPDRLKIGRGEEVNEHLGCTGNTYIQMAGVEYVRDINVIRSRVSRIVSKRYDMYGYIEFYNYIVNKIYSRVPKGLSERDQTLMQYDLLHREFSGRMIIIDEAHNLRDVGEGSDENVDTQDVEMTDAEAGKKLTPVLRDVLDYSEGNKLLLLTATPMYNSVREIIFLFNLLLRNDKKLPLSEAAPGSERALFTEGGLLTPLGEKELGEVAKAYLSFMRGENPLSFPVRLDPLNAPRITFWPSRAPNTETISDEMRQRMIYKPIVEGQPEIKSLPLVEVQFPPETLAIYREIVNFGLDQGGMAVASVDLLVQSGNFIFPSKGPVLYGLTKAPPSKATTVDGVPKARKQKIISHVREYGFKENFVETTSDTVKTVASKQGPPKWLLEANLGKYSPKAAYMLGQIRKSKGVNFVYSRFVPSGALTIALALEANGYVNASRDTGILRDGIQDDLGGQCALCDGREKSHAGRDHAFKQAKYVLLTGRAEYSGNNDKSVKLATAATNKMGEDVKVIVGSQVAAEGIDLAFVRNIFVFDAWFHLNKLEQILGRGIRMCSHALLPPELRNVTIYLLVNTYPQQMNLETIDLYMYRFAMAKAIQMGLVTRFLKTHALDCHLTHDAIVVKNIPDRMQYDSMGVTRPKVVVNDMGFTSLCDWMEKCDYTCKPEGLVVEEATAEESTYDEYSSRFRESNLKKRMRSIFTRQSFYTFEDLETIFNDIPRVSLLSILSDVVDNRNFRVSNGVHQGYVTYRNGYYLFQPDGLMDSRIPLALRVGNFPVKVDVYDPRLIKMEAKQTEAVAVEATEQVNKATLLELWKECITWGVELANKQGTGQMPEKLMNLLKTRYKKNKHEQRKVFSALSMITWMFQSLKFSETLLRHLETVLLCYVWDELLTTAEQRVFYEDQEIYAAWRRLGSMKEIWKENLVEAEGESVFRVLNAKKGELEYYRGGEELKPAQIRFWEGPDVDLLYGIKANTSTTAGPEQDVYEGEGDQRKLVAKAFYGTLNFKYSNIVFKENRALTATAVNPNPKPEAGSECSIISTTGHHMKSLYELGKVAKRAVNIDFGLNETELGGGRSFKVNVVNLCTLKNITLRLLDQMRGANKRWFYRPISTMKTGHRGLIRK